jgi:predicted ATPase/DNA-binding CsgD family transcriptional regulator
VRALEAVPNNLPIQATTFIGREQQLEALCARLLRDDVRLLTLTGPGGTGKTRLALQAAADLLDRFPDGAFFVPLGSVTDPDLVAPAIAQTLEVRETPGRPILASIQDLVRPRKLLLVLDNFEQVAAAAPVAAELAAAAPDLKLLITSRAVLRLYGEHEYPVPPLALPDRRAAPSAAYLAQFEAVQLFENRAQAARPDFVVDDGNAAAVGEVCQRLDGLPLAIELAAARVRTLTPDALLRRLERRLPLLTGGARDLPARQQTLRNTIAWSHDLLSEGEQVLFRRLAVFHGCTLETAETVCAGETPRPGGASVALPPLELDLLDGVESLVEKSLLRREGTPDRQPWYVMLETVREYALERLDESGEAGAVHRRQVLAALRLAETAEREVYGPEQAIWFARLEQEHDNLRAALRWCEAQGYPDPAYRLASALWWFWLAHGHVGEGRERLAALLARFPARAAAPARAALRAQALYGAGVMASIQGDHEAACALHLEGVALRRTSDDRAALVRALQGLGVSTNLRGDHSTARRHLEEALALADDLGEPRLYAAVLHDLGNVLYDLGELGLAAESIAESVSLLRQATSDPRQLASAILSQAVAAQDRGAYDEAGALATESLALYQQAGDRRSEALALAHLGGIALAAGDHPGAREYLSASIAIQQELGDAGGTAFVLERFAALAAAEGRPVGAVRLAATAGALRELAGTPLSASGQARLDSALEPTRRALGDVAVAAADRAGRALTLEQAVAEALSSPGPTPAAEARNGRSDRADSSVLTPREREVAALIARGYTNRQIAEELVITEGTAASHVVHILNRLGARSRAQVAVWATEQGLARARSDDPAG